MYRTRLATASHRVRRPDPLGFRPIDRDHLCSVQTCKPSMGILGIGVDVVHVPRITSLIRRQGDTRFARPILSKKELALWSHIPHDQATVRTQFLAVRYALIARTAVYGEITYQCSWSIKEAAYKAVFPTIRPTWKEFTFHPLSDDGNRKPLLEYHPLETSSISVGKFHASVSHDGDYVFTTVFVEHI